MLAEEALYMGEPCAHAVLYYALKRYEAKERARRRLERRAMARKAARALRERRIAHYATRDWS